MSAPEQHEAEPRPPGAPGDWLVVPGPLHQHEWRWGRIREVLVGEDGAVRYVVRWLGDEADSVVVPPPDARVEPAERWPRPGGDAVGVYR
ncbi:protein of unknown function [Pseudonocardia thermophila]|jgi:Domain of unknown function (DUF1918).|uniref:DUF1918 domain-containing protein n=1 Tax=Pseudonocardia thermophila TaxID=1848 RepID=A0A1M6V1Q6_PSETH|nr:DUF1918 domain-containing protein [Pseudonocardia thermophila]SHK75321.1 protein of unknown function [Pseudonocardia thermophila]